MPVIREKWPSNSFNVCPKYRRKFDAYLAEKAMTYTKLVNGILFACITGDISIDELPYGQVRMSGSIDMTDEDLMNITLRDKEGRILNPTKTFEMEE